MTKPKTTPKTKPVTPDDVNHVETPEPDVLDAFIQQERTNKFLRDRLTITHITKDSGRR
ncbi:hypothetical protein [Lacticaseibacillus jixiensis]|uniref:hypothetical protein n=1 Tax=Lacticaseibacillus jixiensis TaxID=3231926 RepID=UPI0036F32908